VVLKDGKRLNGSVQKYEDGLAYVLLTRDGQSKPMLTTLSEDLIDKEATEATQRRVRPTNNETTRRGSNAENSPSTSSTPGYKPGHEGSQSSQVPSRAELLRAERRAKVETAHAPQRTGTEKRLRSFAKFSRFTAISWKGLQFAGGDFPSGAGFNFGVGFRDNAVGAIYEDPDLPNRVDVNLVAAASTSSYYQLSGDFAFRNLGGSPFSAGVRARYYEWPQQDFYGLGPDSQEDDRTSYLISAVDVGGALWLEPIKGLRVGGGAFYTNPLIGSGTDSRFPSTEEVFPPRSVPGLEVQPDFVPSM